MEITGYDIDSNMFKSTYYADDIPSGKIMLTYQDIKNRSFSYAKDGIIRPYLKMPEGSYYYNNNFIYHKDNGSSTLGFDAIDLTTGYLCALNKRGIKVHEFKGKIKVKNRADEKDFKDILDGGDKFPVEVKNEYGVKVNKVDIRVVGYKYFDKVTGKFLYNNWNPSFAKKWTLCMDENYFGFRFDTMLFRSNNTIILSDPALNRNFLIYDCFRPYTAYEDFKFLDYCGLGEEINISRKLTRYDLGMIPVEEEVWIKV